MPPRKRKYYSWKGHQSPRSKKKRWTKKAPGFAKAKARTKGTGYLNVINASKFAPKSRLIRFVERRTFTVTDTNEFESGTHANPSAAYFWANSPHNWFHQSHGTWDCMRHPIIGGDWADAQDLNMWVAPKDDNDVDQPAKYRTARVITGHLKITCVPNPTTSTSDGYQDSTAIVVRKNTGSTSSFTGKNYSDAFNVDTIRALPYSKTGFTYTNANGTPKGCSITVPYSNREMNRARALGSKDNLFFQDALPTELDMYEVVLLPNGDPTKYRATAGVQIPPHRIELEIVWNCLLGEPVANVFDSGNTGAAFPQAMSGAASAALALAQSLL